MTKFKVKVINTETGEAVKTLEASSQRQAERLEDGLNINLNHARYHTEVEEITPASTSLHTPATLPPSQT